MKKYFKYCDYISWLIHNIAFMIKKRVSLRKKDRKTCDRRLEEAPLGVDALLLHDKISLQEMIGAIMIRV